MTVLSCDEVRDVIVHGHVLDRRYEATHSCKEKWTDVAVSVLDLVGSLLQQILDHHQRAVMSYFV